MSFLIIVSFIYLLFLFVLFSISSCSFTPVNRFTFFNNNFLIFFSLYSLFLPSSFPSHFFCPYSVYVEFFLSSFLLTSRYLLFLPFYFSISLTFFHTAIFLLSRILKIHKYILLWHLCFFLITFSHLCFSLDELSHYILCHLFIYYYFYSSFSPFQAPHSLQLTVFSFLKITFLDFFSFTILFVSFFFISITLFLSLFCLR
jgi:hypothetical protein